LGNEDRTRILAARLARDVDRNVPEKSVVCDPVIVHLLLLRVKGRGLLAEFPFSRKVH